MSNRITPAAGQSDGFPRLLWRAAAEGSLVFFVALLYVRYKLAQWGGFLDFDGHYHIKVAQWIARTGLWFDIPWLPFTVLGERGPDYVWLWHLLLIPFTWFEDLSNGLLWATAVNGAATAAAFAFVMRMLGIPGAPLFALLAVSASELMPYRLMMLRGQNIALIFTLLSVWAIARRRHVVLGVLAFLFMQSYHAALILAPISLIASALQSLEGRKPVLTPAIAVAAGLLLALVISPWFPRHVEYVIFHVLYKQTVLDGHLSALVGSEWYPPGWRRLLVVSWPTHLMLAAALCAVAWRFARDRNDRPPRDTSLAFGVAFLALALQISAIRYVEYYVPFAVLAAALVWRDYWPERAVSRLGNIVLPVWFLVAASLGFSEVERIKVIPSGHLADIGAKLRQLGQPGQMVFNTSWSDFPVLVWHADGLRYVNGLDGHYLAYRDPARFALWIALSNGSVEDPVPVLDQGFGARFVVVAPQHSGLANQLRGSDRVLLHVASGEGWLFEIKKPTSPMR